MRLLTLFATFAIALMILPVKISANELPPQIIALSEAISSVPGVTTKDVRKYWYSASDVSELNAISWAGEYADLPISSLRRSDGNHDNEVLIAAYFTIEKSASGLKGLEFLSWWVRDLSRSGLNIQVRSIGLPPMVGTKIQLGNTLRFSIDMFVETKDPDIEQVLSQIEVYAESLASSYDVYSAAFE